MIRQQVIGGVKIKASGATNLFDSISDTDTGLDLTSVAFNGTSVHYITLHPKVNRFYLTQVDIDYVDGANANDLANVHFFRGPHATDYIQQGKHIWTSGAVPETSTTAGGNQYFLDPPREVVLDYTEGGDTTTHGRLYFNTVWTTAVISCGAGEHFEIRVHGYVDTGGAQYA
jgi:hypothetical protein